MDPTQSFENFKTPFRETQFAVLALSSYFPMKAHAQGWDAAPPQVLSIAELDKVWDRPPDAILRQIENAASSQETLMQQAAIDALGRLAMPESVPLLVKSLGDPSQLVQRTAAWALPPVYRAHPQTPPIQLPAALAPPAP